MPLLLVVLEGAKPQEDHQGVHLERVLPAQQVLRGLGPLPEAELGFDFDLLFLDWLTIFYCLLKVCGKVAYLNSAALRRG
jgi:hypothetical protein